MRYRGRFVAFGVALLAAGPAFGQFFIASGEGSYTITTPAPPSRVALAQLTLNVISGPFSFASASGEVSTDTSVTPAVVTGSVTLVDSVGDELVIDMTGLAFNVGLPFETAAGTWEYLSGTGIFASLTGDGAWQFAVDFSGGFVGPRPMTATFGGTLVPSPASVVLLTLGLCAVRRRR